MSSDEEEEVPVSFKGKVKSKTHKAKSLLSPEEVRVEYVHACRWGVCHRRKNLFVFYCRLVLIYVRLLDPRVLSRFLLCCWCILMWLPIDYAGSGESHCRYCQRACTGCKGGARCRRHVHQKTGTLDLLQSLSIPQLFHC